MIIYFLLLGCIEAACVLCSLFSAISLLHFMKCHRDHVFQLYRGERRFYQDVVVSPRALVGKSLLFPGYQIAYTIIGLLILLAPLLLIGLIAGFIVYLKLTRQISAYLLQRTLSTLPAVVFSILAFLFQLLLNSSIFSDRGSPNITINVANRCNSTKNYNVNNKELSRCRCPCISPLFTLRYAVFPVPYTT